jgi:hypothetical protein
MGDFFMNDRLLNFVTIIFFASIIINGILLMVAATPNGAAMGGLANSDLQYTALGGTVEKPDGFISNTSQSQDASSFNPFTVNSLFAGINAINFIIQGLFLLEIVFVNIAGWFPIFAPILLGVAGIILGAKLLLIGYAGSILLSAITGKR